MAEEKDSGMISFHALPEVQINNEVLETFANIAKNNSIDFYTSLMIGGETGLERLSNLLKQHFIGFNWCVDLDQKEAPAITNAILDLFELDSIDRGKFKRFVISFLFDTASVGQRLLMKSHWWERLGGNKSFGLNEKAQIVATESGLMIKNISEAEDDEIYNMD